MELAKYLTDKRKKQGLSQNDISKALGYTGPQFISNCERGLCAPALGTAKTLAKILNVPKREMIDNIMADKMQKMRKKFN